MLCQEINAPMQVQALINAIQSIPIATQQTGWEQPMICWCRHSEVDGNLVPFSRGVSFYRTDQDGLITWGRDCVEASPPKPGDSTLGLLQILVPILRRMGPENSNPAKITELPIASTAVWFFYLGATSTRLPSVQDMAQLKENGMHCRMELVLFGHIVPEHWLARCSSQI
jgi:hypothetical protein